jgi:hypothetical protein
MSKIARVNTKIFCDACGVEVEINTYRLHCKTAHKSKEEEARKLAKKEYPCNMCGKVCSSNYNLKYHLAHHYNLKNFVCDLCPNAYNTQSDLNQHKRSHEIRGTFFCPESDCREIFPLEIKLQLHLKNIHGKMLENLNHCSKCKRSFSSPWHLQEHLKKHLNANRVFECSECDKTFRQKIKLKDHFNRIHRGLKNYPCIICGKAFGKMNALYEA